MRTLHISVCKREISYPSQYLALVAAELSLQSLNLWVNNVSISMVDELIDLPRLGSLVWRLNSVPAARLKAEVILGKTHVAYVG